jgi:hypothetical protein
MPIPNKDDNDEFRAMGYVCVYAAYVEEHIEECFQTLRHSDPTRPRGLWRAGDKLKSCVRGIKALPALAELRQMLPLFRATEGLLKDRNTAVHSPLYARPGGGNIRRGRPGNEERFVTAAQIYELAEELIACDGALLECAVRLPRFVDAARKNIRP